MTVKRKSRLLRTEVRSKGVQKTIIISPTCLRCGVLRMSSVGCGGAYAAFKVRSTLNGGDRNEKQQSSSASFSNIDGGQIQATPPARYNSKLMNSVWGMYNRYSVHNFKSQIAYDKS